MRPESLGNPEELKRQWEERLAQEGMPPEPESIQSAENPSIEKIRERIQLGYLDRGTVTFGEHLRELERMRAELERAGVDMAVVDSLTEEFFKGIEDEIAQAHIDTMAKIDELTKNDEMLRLDEYRLEKRLRPEIRKMFPHYSKVVQDRLISTILEGYRVRGRA